MRINNLFPFFLALMVLYISSCKKDEIADNTPVDPSLPAAVLNYPLKTFYIQSPSPNSPISDTGERVYFFYDNLKRLSTIIDTSLEIGAPSTTRFSNQQLFYNGNDSFAYKMNSIGFQPTSFGGSSARDTTISFYFYNTLGQLLIDSTISSKIYNPANPNFQYTKRKEIHSYSYIVLLLLLPCNL
jgi:hypothetical protein